MINSRARSSNLQSSGEWERGHTGGSEGRCVGGETVRGENIFDRFTQWEGKWEVTGLDRSDRSGRSVGPWQLEIVLQWMFLSEELMRNFNLWNLIDIDHYSKVSSFSWYFQENRRDRFGFYWLELISPFVTSQQSIKENYSHKWLKWVTKTKNQILSYTLTLPIILVELWKITILCHTRHINAHTSKMKWPRCTKIKTWVTENIHLPFR